jgi:signal transduction histidine kinase/ActR/RegA family two-component response regulator
MATFNDRRRCSSSALPARSGRAFDVLSTAVVRAWRWFLPASTPDQRDVAQRVLAFCLGMSIWVPISAVAYTSLGVPRAVDILLVAGLLLATIPFVLRYSQRPMLCGNLLVAFTLGTYTALALVTGGPAAPVTPWFVSLPIIAVFVTGARWGTLWTLLALITVSLLFAAREMGVGFASPFTSSNLRVLQWAALVRLVLFIAVLTLVFKLIELRQRAALKAAMLAAQAADRAKSEFLANMSHEIRTPLAAILGYTELLREGGHDPNEVEPIGDCDALETIHRNGEHLLQVINDILDLSKIEAGRLDVELSFASPQQIVADVVALFGARAREKKLRFESCFDAELPDAIEIDPTRLRQVLVNIIGNAVKFTEVGTVHVDTKWTGQQSGPGHIEFAIRDSGIGMTTQELSRLFQPFSQADGSTSRRYGGTGLGLAICRRLVQMMDGTIEVTSELDKGSCFTVSLPVARTRLQNANDAKTDNHDVAPHESSISRSADNSWLAGYRILLAEDSPDNQRLIRHLLQRAGAEVVLADNGQLALDSAVNELRQGTAFDLVLMDMQMPVLDGYEATTRLRAAGYRQPIVALTAHALSSEHDKCRAAGCDEVCTKPIERASFFAAICRRVKQPQAG